MDPIWYTIRTVVTVVMAGIGGLLLWAGYLVAGNVPGAAIAWMVLLAVAIPAGFFAMFTIVGWQRSTAAQAKPSPLIAWCGAPRHYAVLWLAFVGLLFGGAYQIVQEIKRGDTERADLQAYHRAVRDTLFDACWNRAGQSFREETGSGDVSLRPRLMHYCTCLDIAVEKSFTPGAVGRRAEGALVGAGRRQDRPHRAAMPDFGQQLCARGTDDPQERRQSGNRRDAAEASGLYGLCRGGARQLRAGGADGIADRPRLAGRRRQVPPYHRALHQIRRALTRDAAAASAAASRSPRCYSTTRLGLRATGRDKLKNIG